MRESFIFIIAICTISVKCIGLDKDGFNTYKDHLRNHQDESEIEDRILYFYRTPLQVYLSQLADIPEHRKRAETNFFKRYMLNRELRPEKRTSKAALSLMLQSKHDGDHGDDGHYCLYGK